jgi:hypothetical protein
MRRSCNLLALLAVIALGALAALAEEKKEEPHNTPPEGFTALFNGKDLSGWQGGIHLPDREKLKGEELEKRQKAADALMKETWSVKEGVLMMKPKVDDKSRKSGLNLATVKDYRDFELLLDWKIEKAGDSGVYLRGQPQVQIWDSDNAGGAQGKDKHSGSGGLWNNPEDKGKRPLVKADKPVGEWNHFRIILKNDKVTVYLNGKLVVQKQPLLNIWQPTKPLQKQGPIELQYHGDPLWFRNIYVKELKD